MFSSCVNDYVVSGPYTSVPERSEITLEAQLEALSGEPVVAVDIASNSGQTINVHTEPLKLHTGQAQRITLSTRFEKPAANIEFRLRSLSGNPGERFRIIDASVTRRQMGR